MIANKNIKSGLFWSFAQQVINQVISFGISIILARLLLPKDFGVIGMIYVFMTFGNLLLDAGMSLSLIRTQNIKDIDYNTVFVSNILIAIFLFLSLFFLASLHCSFLQSTHSYKYY
ncbi:MAG: oligosaccharide flippase family protein [Flavobacterium sp.]|nr:oligosaccharide flippase family protein [Flavobacterium sp.]